MGGAQARRLCPQAVVVEPRMAAYAEASKAVFEVFDDTTPLVEGLSIDEAFLDVARARAHLGHAAGDRRAAAARRSASRSACRSRSGWPGRSSSPRWPAAWPSRTVCSWCRPSGELAFLHPLPVERLWGVGAVTARKLRERGSRPSARWPLLAEATLVAMLGRAAGRHLHALAHNRDPRPRARGPPSPLDRGAARARALHDDRASALDAVLVGLVDRLARRLRAARRVCRTVVLRLRFGDFSRATRSHTLAAGHRADAAILATGRALLAPAMPMIEKQGVTLVGVALGNLRRRRGPARAAARRRGVRVPSTPRSTTSATGSARGAITRAVLLGRDQGPTVPLLPD